jgi:hypothetical protein
VPAGAQHDLRPATPMASRGYASSAGNRGITPGTAGRVIFRCAVIIVAKGGVLQAQRSIGAATFQMLWEIGISGPGMPALREICDSGQCPVEELADSYQSPDLSSPT